MQEFPGGPLDKAPVSNEDHTCWVVAVGCSAGVNGGKNPARGCDTRIVQFPKGVGHETSGFRLLYLPLLHAFAAQARAASIPHSIPHLEKRGAVTQLIVDDKPFLALAGELHNSSSSSRQYMRPIWPRLARMNLNTVLAVVTWELIEPEEGKFDFTLVDGMIEDARRFNMRLVFLWFGSWKNGESSYPPYWVKTDGKRFPLAECVGQAR